MNHWATDYIGLSWDPTGDGQTSFNCWTFVQDVQRKHYGGRELPDILTNATSDLAVARACAIESGTDRWEPVDEPEDGDCVLLCRATHPVHVGVWVRANGTAGVLHCSRGAGVVFQPPASLRASGWGRLSYYRWKQ